MDDGDGTTDRRRGGLRNRWRRRTHHPLSACLRLLRGELHPERNRYRDVLLAIALGVTVWAVITASNASGTAKQATATAHRALAQVQQGRSTSIGVICAVQSALGEAGKETITGGGVLPPALDIFLQSHGYPPLSVRQKAAREQAARYVNSIGRHIEKELAQRGKSANLAKRLLRKDGTIDCRELSSIANVRVR